MICTQEKGHEGLCTAGEVSGGCKKTAAKWFVDPNQAVELPITGEEIKANLEELVANARPDGVDGISDEELAGSSEQQLAMLYRRQVHPTTRQEAVEWARSVVAARDLGVGAA